LILDDADLDAPDERKLPAAELRERAVVRVAALRIGLVAIRGIRLQHDLLSAAPFLEAIGARPHGIRHRPARAIGVRLDDFARRARGGDGREVGEKLVVGEVELELQRVAVERQQALHRCVVVELARFPRLRHDGLRAHEAAVE
jgi:hypothetical protein